MAVAPDAIHRVESVAELDGAARAGGPGGVPGPDDPRPRRMAEHPGGRPGALARALGPGPQRPVLRHHQPPGGVAGDRRPLRRHGRDRQRQLLQHPGAGAHGQVRRLRPGRCASTPPPSSPTTFPAWSGSSPGLRRPSRWSRRSCAASPPSRGPKRSGPCPRTSTFPSPGSCAKCCAASPPSSALAAFAPAAAPGRPSAARPRWTGATCRRPRSWPPWDEPRPEPGLPNNGAEPATDNWQSRRAAPVWRKLRGRSVEWA